MCVVVVVLWRGVVTIMGLLSSKEDAPSERPESVVSSTKSPPTTTNLQPRQASIRQSTIKAKSKQPMPDPAELERRFTKVLVSSRINDSFVSFTHTCWLLFSACQTNRFFAFFFFGVMLCQVRRAFVVIHLFQGLLDQYFPADFITTRLFTFETNVIYVKQTLRSVVYLSSCNCFNNAF